MERQPNETRQNARRVELQCEDSWMMRWRISVGMALEREEGRSCMPEGRRRVEAGGKERKGELRQFGEGRAN